MCRCCARLFACRYCACYCARFRSKGHTIASRQEATCLDCFGVQKKYTPHVLNTVMRGEPMPAQHNCHTMPLNATTKLSSQAASVQSSRRSCDTLLPMHMQTLDCAVITVTVQLQQTVLMARTYDPRTCAVIWKEPSPIMLISACPQQQQPGCSPAWPPHSSRWSRSASAPQTLNPWAG